MDIKFNPSRVSSTGPSQPASKQDSTVTATDGASFQGTEALEEKLKNLQAIRPEKVQQAKLLASRPDYPPDDVLDRIAVLLAINSKSVNY